MWGCQHKRRALDMLSMGCKWKTRRAFLKSFTFNCSMLWNATCPDTFAQSHRSLALVHSANGIVQPKLCPGPQESEITGICSALIFFSTLPSYKQFSVSTLSLLLMSRQKWHTLATPSQHLFWLPISMSSGIRISKQTDASANYCFSLLSWALLAAELHCSSYAFV